MKCVPRVMYVGSTAVVVSAAAASRRGVVDASSWRAKATVNMMHCGSQSVRQRWCKKTIVIMIHNSFHSSFILSLLVGTRRTLILDVSRVPSYLMRIVKFHVYSTCSCFFEFVWVCMCLVRLQCLYIVAVHQEKCPAMKVLIHQLIRTVVIHGEHGLNNIHVFGCLMVLGTWRSVMLRDF